LAKVFLALSGKEGWWKKKCNNIVTHYRIVTCSHDIKKPDLLLSLAALISPEIILPAFLFQHKPEAMAGFLFALCGTSEKPSTPMQSKYITQTKRQLESKYLIITSSFQTGFWWNTHVRGNNTGPAVVSQFGEGKGTSTFKILFIIIESLWLEKTTRTSQSNHQPIHHSVPQRCYQGFNL